jgi:16S rRNA processing protein RimM
LGLLENYFLIADIISVFSEDGYVKIKSHSDFPERFFLLNEIYIDIFGDKRLFIIEDVERIEGYFILKFKNFDFDVDVEFLVGSSIYVNEKDVVALDDETYFIHDLVGCNVFFNDKFFGKIVDILSLTSNDVYVIEDNDGNEKLIPAVSEFILDINIEKKIIFLKQDFDELSDDEN